METPSSNKRVTRSQTMAALNNTNIPISRKIEDSEKGVSKSRSVKQQQQQDRSALIDITNDSPIVGLAVGSLETPSSAMAKQRSLTRGKNNNTPGSGEALLRGQVKTLLQKVEEEAELSKISLENRPFLHLQGLVNSPMGLIAPTPANTPQVPNLPADDGSIINNTPLPVVEEHLKICQVVNEIFGGNLQESLETQKSLTRSLMLDFSEKSETSDSSSECSSAVTTCTADKSLSPKEEEDDSASNWSIQVNASTHDEEEEDQVIEEEEEDYYYARDYEKADEDLVQELCEGIGKVSVSESGNSVAAVFTGKHTRFRYNSDDDDGTGKMSVSVAAMFTGKHTRFRYNSDDDEIVEEVVGALSSISML